MANTETSASSEVQQVLSARSATELFGSNRKRAKNRYHRLARAVHPDATGGSEEAMSRLNTLWDEYNDVGNGKKAHPTGIKTPREVSRSSAYAMFEEDCELLVVKREPSDTIPLAFGVEDLKRVIEGTPTCLLSQKSCKFVAQKDGPHLAYRCESVGEDPIFVQELQKRLQDGVLDPRDLAWVAKRALFLASAMEKCGVRLAGDASDRLVVLPKAHMLAIAAPWDLVGAKNDDNVRQNVLKSFLDAVDPAIGHDKCSERIKKWLKGAYLDNVTLSRELFDEYDWLLRELFGPPRYHELVV